MEVPVNGEALLLRLLQGTGRRSQAIASNIANQNTPGYKRQVVRFEDMLAQALEAGGEHLLSIEPAAVTDNETPARLDGNNVNLELEVYASRENRVLAETYRTILQGHYQMLDAAISNGN